ncbi:MAG: hypothetical protein GY701_31195, partial [Sulfitobacter sp.]|nr:hypothetical protein [Sulfitobacter sp.]
GTGFGVSDVDEAGSGATATLTAGEGVVTVISGDSGVTIDSGNGTGTVALSGTIAQINSLLDDSSTGTINYLNNSNAPSASTTFTVTVNDAGNTGTDPGLTGDGTSEEGTNSQTINITATNDDPTNAGSLPSDITVTQDISGNVDLSAIDISDIDAASGSLTMTLTTSTGGNLTATTGGGVTVSGSGTGTLTLDGTLANLNTFLDTASNITYLHGTPGTNGEDADTIQINANDNGNTGAGGGTDIDFGTVNVDIDSTAQISGTVFEDADYAGTPSNWDGGVNDPGLANVDVELYSSTDVYLASTTTAGDGSFTFSGLTDGGYKVRARSATIGDADTQPAGGLHPTVPGIWPYPLPEMTWAGTAALIGGQDQEADDTATGNDAGPGDTWVALTVSGADLAGVNLGFNFELVVTTADDGLADALRSQQGSLRQFIKNSNAIVGTSTSRFEIQAP